MSAFAEIVVTLPVPGRFHYAVPEALRGTLAVGHRVLVPFGRRRVTGFVVALADVVEPELAAKLKPIAERLDLEPLLPPDILNLAAFTAEYYLATPGEVLKIALPPGLTAASINRLVITPRGRLFLEEHRDYLPDGARLEPGPRHLLASAARARGVKASEASAKDMEVLLTAGLLAKKQVLGAKESDNEEEILERLLAPKEAWPHLQRARTRLELYGLLEAGPQPLAALEARMGKEALRRALARLEADGVVQRRRVSKAVGAPRPILAPGAQLPELTAEQQLVLAPIGAAIDQRAATAFLLHGVTGSGKTEVYLRAIAHARVHGRGAVVLVPEIALTPQLEERFRARFGDDVVVLHSGVPDAERRRRWHQLRSGAAKIALGARSALWAPVVDLGVVVVDEEHDPSFKQGSDVRYNGRDLALARAHRTGAVALLGSATPSLESLQLVRTGRLTELRLASRVGARPMPTIEVVDLTEERRAMKGDIQLLSRPLADRLRDVVAKKQQAILFLNRRGFNTIVYCEECSEARKCRSCDVSLTHHRAARILACHYCGHHEGFDSPCPKCGGRGVTPFGAGTERVVEAVKEAVPDVRVLRLDRDVTARAGALDETLTAFRAGEADVLVGTQMVAKGHDFPRVTLVGVLLADASLAFPDFRAAERTFQLLTQVAGRAGRADDPGHVVIQTFQPQHYALTSALAHDADGFFELESTARRGLGYPPFARLGLIRVESKSQDDTKAVAAEAAQLARRHAAAHEAKVVGPAPAPIERLRERYRHMVMIRAPSPARLVAVMGKVKAELDAQPRRADVVYDVDPTDLL